MQRHRIDRRTRESRSTPTHSGGHDSPTAVAAFLEDLAARLFRRLGYRLHRRPATHDLGVDLVVARPGLRAIVQCKRWRHPVGPAVVRDLYGTLLHTGADLGILATTSTISQSARRFAQGKPLLLPDGPLLYLLLPDSLRQSGLRIAPPFRYTAHGTGRRAGGTVRSFG